MLLAVAVSAFAGCAVRLPDGPVALTPPPGVTLQPLANRADAFRFAVLGDFGDGSVGQRELAQRMALVHETAPFGLVITVGDNIYGGESPGELVEKFEQPYAALLERGVRFQASLGNHDTDRQLTYPPFNMNGQAYYTFTAADGRVRFFALDSTRPDEAQRAWLERALADATEEWKIAYFHHPLYSTAARHGSNVPLRFQWEPLFERFGVSAVFAGHDHAYERIEPQRGIAYFVAGSGGKLRKGDLDQQYDIRVNGFDRDLVFMVIEISGEEMQFNAISRLGQIVDAGRVTRRLTTVPPGR